MDEATGRLVKLIRAEKPQVIVTYNDDHRGYPHPDHVKVHEISVRAFERAGDQVGIQMLAKFGNHSKCITRFGRGHV